MGEVAISRTLERVLCSASNAHKNFRNTSLNLKVKLDNRSIRNITIISVKIKSQSKAKASTDDFSSCSITICQHLPPIQVLQGQSSIQQQPRAGKLFDQSLNNWKKFCLSLLVYPLSVKKVSVSIECSMAVQLHREPPTYYTAGLVSSPALSMVWLGTLLLGPLPRF